MGNETENWEDCRAYMDLVKDWSGFIAQDRATEHVELLRLHERTGRPLGSDEFMGRLEKTIGRKWRRKSQGQRGQSKAIMVYPVPLKPKIPQLGVKRVRNTK